ncbi:MAG: RHS repeat protein [Chitinophagaceae bacterium]|nr:RHS repeat protein [Chitinophagaceae bacterium]
MATYINKNNETRIINYDASNRVVKLTGPTGNQASLSYDGMDNLKAIKNALGHETKMNYDNRNRVNDSKDPEITIMSIVMMLMAMLPVW